MDDYVLRKSVYDALCKICNGRDMCEHTGQEGCHKVFSQIPAADVVSVVRCKDCKHRILTNRIAECELDTGDPYQLGRNAEDDNWFCADGERKGKTDDAE